MDIRPSNAEIARFLRKFEKDGVPEKTVDLMAQEGVPYGSDPESRILLEWCVKNALVDFKVRGNRFGDYSVSTEGKLFLMQQRSSSRRLRYWIEDHPFAWSSIVLVAGWIGGTLSKYAEKFVHF